MQPLMMEFEFTWGIFLCQCSLFLGPFHVGSEQPLCCVLSCILALCLPFWEESSICNLKESFLPFVWHYLRGCAGWAPVRWYLKAHGDIRQWVMSVLLVLRTGSPKTSPGFCLAHGLLLFSLLLSATLTHLHLIPCAQELVYTNN